MRCGRVDPIKCNKVSSFAAGERGSREAKVKLIRSPLPPSFHPIPPSSISFLAGGTLSSTHTSLYRVCVLCSFFPLPLSRSGFIRKQSVCCAPPPPPPSSLSLCERRRKAIPHLIAQGKGLASFQQGSLSPSSPPSPVPSFVPPSFLRRVFRDHAGRKTIPGK